MIFPVAASAQQNLRSGYFLDGYTYKYKMNPAMAPERGFFAMPVLGNMGIGMESNLGLSDFLYPTESGKLATFLSPNVSNEEFLKHVPENHRMNMNYDLNILAFGFRTGKSYHTVDLSTRIDGSANVPGSLYSFMKVGSALGDYNWDISNIGMKASARAQLAYGYSRSINEALTIGARVKLLMGMFNLDVTMDKMQLEMSADRWAVEAHGDMILSDNISEFSPSSFGFGIDLGATYDFLDYFTASLSVLDLGSVSWNNTTIASTPDTSWSFDGFDNVQMTSMGEQISEMISDLTGAFAFEKKEVGVKKSAGLAATIHAGIEARMPFYERLSFGMLYTQKIDGVYSFSEGRLAASVAPTNWFSLTTNYAISNLGHSWGGAVNLHLPGFGIFFGLDSLVPLMNVTPQFIPVNAVNTNMAFGINFSFGKYHGRFAK